MYVGDGVGGGDGVAGVGTMLVVRAQCVEGGRGGVKERQWFPAPTFHNRTYIDKKHLMHKQQRRVCLSVCNYEEDLTRECDGEWRE